MGDMAMPSFVVDKNVIKKDEEKMMKKWFKYVVHETLECGMWIAKANGHHQELVMAFMNEKIKFGNTLFFHVNLLISRIEIKFGEELSTFELIEEVVNGGNGEIILKCYFVESLKVKTCIPSPLFF